MEFNSPNRGIISFLIPADSLCDPLKVVAHNGKRDSGAEGAWVLRERFEEELPVCLATRRQHALLQHRAAEGQVVLRPEFARLAGLYRCRNSRTRS